MFRLINFRGRAALDVGGHAVDLATLTGEPQWADSLFAVAHHRELEALASRAATADATSFHVDELGAPVPTPRQVFAIGLNYRDHAAETNKPLPPSPLTFTKFPSCLAGPTSSIPIGSESVDWEVELVVVIGDECRSVPAAKAWNHVAGVTLGQDISDRAVQYEGTPPQFSLGKSFEGFGPTGPAVVSVDDLANRDDIELWCEVNGERVQHSRTGQLIFPVATLVSYLSSIVVLYPGDLIFTGTPAGVGAARGRFLNVGDVVVSFAEGVGELRNECRAGS
jgi:2-keto-4-pentenoate hydratase/2-oxohepta-3-ene-1,7-dioic acid hydratase in catechol pathway